MSVENTSMLSYRKALVDGLITKRHMQVLEYMWNHRDSIDGISQGDVGRYFNDASSSFQPRFRELEFNAIIENIGTKYDPVTKRHVKSYKLTGVIPASKLKKPINANQAACDERVAKLRHVLHNLVYNTRLALLEPSEHNYKKLENTLTIADKVLE